MPYVMGDDPPEVGLRQVRLDAEDDSIESSGVERALNPVQQQLRMRNMVIRREHRDPCVRVTCPHPGQGE
jgi:hypothetical protein